ncbi:site-specific integrase [Alkalihalobacillus sp. AL-G]|uniref:tyrosine-type recombinase/integrase n=1 Tax=Alkalihalobacillus sp. AL-G TaxID=2926399 RepID=UPI00272C5CD2|nr:site-specific integrase [Alkalihalobacillus sp. AL-G]WLD95238.1 phage integrase N-terminal SAM-like domain-containing protein [Alkalihalobacillus sp. AL-G]
MKTEEKPQHAIEFIIFLEKRGKRPATVKRYRYDLEDFLAWIRVNELTYIDGRVYTSEFVQSYFDYLAHEREYSFRTIKRVYSVLKQYYHYLTDQRVIPENPLNGIKINVLEKEYFTEDMFVTEGETAQLLETMSSEKGLTENQLKAHPYLAPRNVSIISLMLNYGLSLQDIVSMDIRHVSFIQKQIVVRSSNGQLDRHIDIDGEIANGLYRYYQLIPEAVRPAQYHSDPLFVAFDFQRLTYRWSYEEDRPKRLTEIAIQKMIRQEVERSGLRKGISGQHFRRTAILKAIQSEEKPETIQQRFGLKTPLTLNRFYEYLN